MTRIPFETIPIQECGEPLVDLTTYGITTEPMYFKQGYSNDPSVRARRGIAERLQKAQELLGDEYRLKVWDAHRPRTVQAAIYDAFRADTATKNPDATDEEVDAKTQVFVTKATNPNRIPPHATGGTVDLTLIDREGKELNMGTEFDHFGPEATPHYFEDNSNQTARQNRTLLFDAMTGAGFALHEDEWWHFDYGNQVWAYKTNQQAAIYGEAFIDIKN